MPTTADFTTGQLLRSRTEFAFVKRPGAGRGKRTAICHPVSVTFELEVDRVAAGGDGLGTAPDGRVVFVPGSVPGDRLTVGIVQQKKQFIRAKIDAILEPSPDRVEVPCAHVAEGCGGCDWQHINVDAQAKLRVDLVQDALRRIAKIDTVDVAAGPTLDATGYRTTARLAISGGKAGFRVRRSNDVLLPDSCLVLHPALDELVTTANFGSAEEVVLRVGARTGDLIVHVAAGSADGMSLPDGVILSTTAAPAALTEVVGGHRFTISGPSFFQCRPEGAETMVDLVAEAISGVDGPLVDAYAGVGLFGALLGNDRPLTSVEAAPSSVADSRVNLPEHATIVESDVEQWTPTDAGAVIADPARAGLGPKGVEVLSGTGAHVMALVSCDVASMARDVGLLMAAGFEPEWARTIDLFGHTSHVEVVTRLVRR